MAALWAVGHRNRCFPGRRRLAFGFLHLGKHTAVVMEHQPTPRNGASELRLGVHLSLGHSPQTSLSEAHRRGARCAQIFCSSPSAWKAPVLRDRKVADINQCRRELGIHPLVIHAIYLINLASPDDLLVRRSVSSLVATLEAGEVLGADAVITHIGSHGGRGHDPVAPAVVAALLEIVSRASGTVTLALENSAGAGNILGAEIEALADLLDRAGNHPRLTVAIDTAHLCGAGWDFTVEGTAARLVDTLADRIGLDRVRALHINDSKVPPGSRRDRHANIGDGYIGLPGFRSLMDQPALRRIPWILETPDLDSALPPEERFGGLARLIEMDRQTG
jgi:deoxyribonuclease-4